MSRHWSLKLQVRLALVCCHDIALMSSLVEAFSDVVSMSQHLNNSVLPTVGNVVAMSGQCRYIGWML